MSQISISDFSRLSQSDPTFRLGCLVDTNVVFAASTDTDHWNTWASSLFSELNHQGVPAYTNINIRSEYLDLYRRAIMPESLLTFRRTYEEMVSKRSETIERAFKRLDTRMREAKAKNDSLLLNDREIKDWERLFRLESLSLNEKLWDLFCRIYVLPQMTGQWDRTTAELGLNFAGSRATDEKELFNSRPEWSEVEDIMGRTGIASYDAMILNFFQCSKFQVIATADQQVAAFAERIKPDAWILVPNETENQ